MNDDEFRAALGDDGDAARLARQGGLDLDALTEGRGTIDTRVVVRVLPAAVVAAMLPAGLQLAPQPLVPPDHHPIFVSFAHNHFSAWFGEMDYHEVMLGIPWVEFAEERMPHRGPFIYMPRLYLDAAIPQILGERIYGYEKLAGEFTVDGDTWRVRDANGDLAVTASFERDPDALDDASGSDEELARAPEAWPHFAWVRKLLEQPTISQALRRFDRDARVLGDDDQRFVGSTVRYLTAGVDWDGRPVDATVLPILATVGFGDALTLPAGLPPTPERSASIAGDVLGAFRLRTKQVVSPPGSPFEAHYPPGGGRKLRVAVLGGGPSACAAAYYLARQRDAYEVSLYTMGWRLGGKCAAGRNRDAHDRIEEHGLHAFLGFYRNAIRTVGEVYRDAGRSLGSDDGPVSGALRPQANVGVLDRFDDRWTYFPTPMGPNDRVPGRVPPGASAQERPEGAAIPLGAILRRIADELQDAVGGDGDAPLDRVFSLLSAPWREAMTSLVAWVDREGAIALERFVETPPAASRTKRWMIAILEQVRSGLAWYFEDRVRSSRTAHFQWGGLDTLLTIARGVLVESTLDFDDLDDRDMIAWLLEHGLAEEHASISTITQVYETLFAHAPDLPYRVADLACGVGLRWFLLVSFGYDGHPAYDFRWSCPETLMTPYYEALRAHGAEIHFFHRVEGITVAGQGAHRRLDAVKLRVQATVRGAGPYEPFLADAAAPGCPPAWPLAPDFDQLVEGDVLRERRIDLEDVYADWPGVGERELQWGRDFDVCVLGVPLGALPTIVAPLVDPASPYADPRWQALVEGTALIQTVSAHLWFDRPASAMFDTSDHAVERTGEADPRRGLLTGFVQPVGSLGEMTPLVAVERWPDPKPQLLTYHTGALFAGARLPPPGAAWRDYPAQQREHWRSLFHEWLRANHRSIFDAGPRDFDDLLAALRVPDGPPREGLERLWAQAFNVACQPSDLYVLSRPGETKHRLAPSASGVRFLLLAGDWTKTDMNCGCVEAATQSGMLAARALSNEPAYVWRVGY